MQRIIKFRGKPIEDVDFDNIGVHISKDDFVYGNLIVDGEQAWIVKGVIESTNDYITLEQWIPVRPETVGQFTGLLDVNGKEIYDGDIAKRGDGRTDTITYEDGEYTTEKQGWGLTWLIKHRLGDMGENIEIIGNIHDKED